MNPTPLLFEFSSPALKITVFSLALLHWSGHRRSLPFAGRRLAALCAVLGLAATALDAETVPGTLSTNKIGDGFLHEEAFVARTPVATNVVLGIASGTSEEGWTFASESFRFSGQASLQTSVSLNLLTEDFLFDVSNETKIDFQYFNGSSRIAWRYFRTVPKKYEATHLELDPEYVKYHQRNYSDPQFIERRNREFGDHFISAVSTRAFVIAEFSANVQNSGWRFEYASKNSGTIFPFGSFNSELGLLLGSSSSSVRVEYRIMTSDPSATNFPGGAGLQGEISYSEWLSWVSKLQEFAQQVTINAAGVPVSFEVTPLRNIRGFVNLPEAESGNSYKAFPYARWQEALSHIAEMNERIRFSGTNGVSDTWYKTYALVATNSFFSRRNALLTAYARERIREHLATGESQDVPDFVSALINESELLAPDVRVLGLSRLDSTRLYWGVVRFPFKNALRPGSLSKESRFGLTVEEPPGTILLEAPGMMLHRLEATDDITEFEVKLPTITDDGEYGDREGWGSRVIQSSYWLEFKTRLQNSGNNAYYIFWFAVSEGGGLLNTLSIGLRANAGHAFAVPMNTLADLPYFLQDKAPDIQPLLIQKQNDGSLTLWVNEDGSPVSIETANSVNSPWELVDLSRFVPRFGYEVTGRDQLRIFRTRPR